MRYFFGVLIVLLLVLHQDNWYWTNATLVGGFMPIGLLYHAGISIAAAFVWFLATIFIWPQEVPLDDDPVRADSGKGVS